MFFKIRVGLFISLLIFFATSTVFAGPSMPKKLASEFTQYPNSTIIHTITSNEMVQVILHCGNEPMDTVFDYYKEKASQSGWTDSMEIKSVDVYQLMITKNNQDGMIVVTSENGETSVVLSISN